MKNLVFTQWVLLSPLIYIICMTMSQKMDLDRYKVGLITKLPPTGVVIAATIVSIAVYILIGVMLYEG
jgi:hypothetical protein